MDMQKIERYQTHLRQAERPAYAIRGRVYTAIGGGGADVQLAPDVVFHCANEADAKLLQEQLHAAIAGVVAPLLESYRTQIRAAVS